MILRQTTITLRPRGRGFHLVTGEIVDQTPAIGRLHLGMANLFLQHTSAALALNENADPTVRADMEAYFSRLAPEDAPYYQHTIEGPDDMPAHLKAVLLGSSLTIPISEGRLNLGTWQGVYLCEHRDNGGPRRLVVTVWGEGL
jgi:secondary thiamine-phosphate synthase enzyme